MVVLDGQALRGSGPTQWVGAIAAGSGRTLGVQAGADPRNEIPAGQTLLDRLAREGTLALMEALHPQVQTVWLIPSLTAAQATAARRTGPPFLAKMSRRRGELSRCITRPVRR